MSLIIVILSILATVHLHPQKPLHDNWEDNKVTFKTISKRAIGSHEYINDHDEGKVAIPVFLFNRDAFDEIPEIFEESENKTTPSRTSEITTLKPDTTESGGRIRPAACSYDPKEDIQRAEKKIDKRLKRVSAIKCELNMWEYKYKIMENGRKADECAKLSTDSSGVYNGKKVTQGDFPHMGAVGWLKTDLSGYIYMCGCSLISNFFALTAAHCNSTVLDGSVNYVSPEIVLFGDVYVGDKQNATLTHERAVISKIFTLPLYRSLYSHYNDIALIRFAAEVTFNINVRPACLYTIDEDYTGAVNVTGWGQTSVASSSADLLYAKMRIASRTECSEGWEYKSNWVGLYAHQFCAKRVDGDSGQGDSGGPLQIQTPLPPELEETGDMYHIVGITIAGGRYEETTPSLYTKVNDENFLCWIETIVWPDEPNDKCRNFYFQGYNITIP